jgi:hypothetical protein
MIPASTQRLHMATEHDVLKLTDLAAQIEAWKDRFMSEVGIAKYWRVAAHPVPGRAQVTYKLKLERPWTGAVEAAALHIPDIMQAQLADNVRHRGTPRVAAGNIIN